MDIGGDMVDRVWLFSIGGRLDAQSAGEAESRVKEWLAEGRTLLAGDLSRLDYISSAGLRVMLVAAKAVKAQGGGVCVFGLKDSVRAVFDISGFSAIIPIVESREEALAWAGGLS